MEKEKTVFEVWTDHVELRRANGDYTPKQALQAYDARTWTEQTPEKVFETEKEAREYFEQITAVFGTYKCDRGDVFNCPVCGLDRVEMAHDDDADEWVYDQGQELAICAEGVEWVK